MPEYDDTKHDFARESHVQYFKMHLNVFPQPYSSQDTNRITLLFFCVSALDLMGYEFSQQQKENIIEWIYSLQIVCGAESGFAGFRGGSALKINNDSDDDHTSCDLNPFDTGHLAMTYTALATLRILGDPLDRVDKKALTVSMRRLQSDEDGCFTATRAGSEKDVRFLYCACVISTLLQDWSGVDREKALRYILSSQSSADYAFAHGPHMESHGGSSYCAISAYKLIKASYEDDNVNVPLPHERELVEWLLRRQINGFHGRPQKDSDTCYSFWVGASLSQLYDNALLRFVDRGSTITFTMGCQNSKIGGISKSPGVYPDVMHSYMALAGLSLLRFKGLKKLCPSLNMSEECCRRWMTEQQMRTLLQRD